jgi:hypothetical protein
MYVNAICCCDKILSLMEKVNATFFIIMTSFMAGMWRIYD